MKSLASLFFTALLFLASESFAQQETIDYCEREATAEKTKKELKPYRYSGAKIKKLKIKEYNQIQETVIEMLYDTKYKIIFNRSGVPDGQTVDVIIYDKPYGKRNREIVWKSTDGQDLIELETESLEGEYDKLYVEYEMPAYEKEVPDGVRIAGCMVMTIGYDNMTFHTDRGSED